jgi:hypothetical protein
MKNARAKKGDWKPGKGEFEQLIQRCRLSALLYGVRNGRIKALPCLQPASPVV